MECSKCAARLQPPPGATTIRCDACETVNHVFTLAREETTEHVVSCGEIPTGEEKKEMGSEQACPMVIQKIAWPPVSGRTLKRGKSLLPPALLPGIVSTAKLRLEASAAPEKKERTRGSTDEGLKDEEDHEVYHTNPSNFKSLLQPFMSQTYEVGSSVSFDLSTFEKSVTPTQNSTIRIFGCSLDGGDLGSIHQLGSSQSQFDQLSPVVWT